MKFSFIIPYFNGSDHIQKTIKSIEQQTSLASKEIIIIDDFSETKEYEFLLNIDKNNLKILRQNQNEGPGSARNRGIKVASGDYIVFVDADDTIESNLLELIEGKLYSNPDVITFNYYLCIGNKKTKQNIFSSNISKSGINFQEQSMVFVKGTPWGKAFKRSFIEKYIIKFSKEKRGEDTPFTKTALMLSSKTVHIDLELYNYRMHDKSIMHQSQLHSEESILIGMDMIQEALIINKLDSVLREEFEAVFLKEYTYGTLSSSLNYKNKIEKIRHIKKITDNRFTNWSNNKYVKLFPSHTKMGLYLLNKNKLFMLLKFEQFKFVVQKIVGIR